MTVHYYLARMQLKPIFELGGFSFREEHNSISPEDFSSMLGYSPVSPGDQVQALVCLPLDTPNALLSLFLETNCF